MSGESDVEGALAELRRAFRESRPARFEALRAAVEEGALDRAKALAHKLYGTAGTYGVPEVGEHARVLEEAIDGALAMPSDEALRKVNRALDAFMTCGRPSG